MNWEAIFTEGVSLHDAAPVASVWFGGDVCPSGELEKRLASGQVEGLLSGLPERFHVADFRMANLEGPLSLNDTDIAKSGPSLGIAPGCAVGLKGLGLDVLGLANNHIMDKGAAGLEATVQVCRDAGILTCGAGANLSEASTPLFLEANGVRIGIVAAAEVEFNIAGSRHAGAAPLEPLENFAQIARAREEADCVLFVLHAGNEHYELPRPRLQKYCRFLIEAGASAVVCHHTHVTGPIEIYRGRPIAYGLGNFLFPWTGRRPSSWYRGMSLGLSIGASGNVVMLNAGYFEQGERSVGTKPVSVNQLRAFAARFAEMCELLTSELELEAAWRVYCGRERQKYLLKLRAPALFPGVGRILRGAPWLESLILSDRQLQVILNVLRCDSHRDAAERALELTMSMRESQDEA